MSDLREIDSRGRISLGGLAEHKQYLVTRELDGTLTLTPAVVMTDLEARILRNADLMASIAANNADPSRMVPRPRRPERA